VIQIPATGVVLAECDRCHQVVRLDGVLPGHAEAAVAQRHAWTVWQAGRSPHPRTYCPSCHPAPRVVRSLKLTPAPLD